MSITEPIIQRKYSVAEINCMRKMISSHQCELFGNGPYKPADRTTQVEEVLRTYMMAGVSMNELSDGLEDEEDD